MSKGLDEGCAHPPQWKLASAGVGGTTPGDGARAGTTMNASNLDYGELQRTHDLTHQVWEAGVLTCLLDGPKRYTDIGAWLGIWSRVRPGDSAITRSTARLAQTGHIERIGHGRHARYQLTTAGRRRAELLAELAALVHDRSED